MGRIKICTSKVYAGTSHHWCFSYYPHCLYFTKIFLTGNFFGVLKSLKIQWSGLHWRCELCCMFTWSTTYFPRPVTSTSSTSTYKVHSTFIFHSYCPAALVSWRPLHTTEVSNGQSQVTALNLSIFVFLDTKHWTWQHMKLQKFPLMGKQYRGQSMCHV